MHSGHTQGLGELGLKSVNATCFGLFGTQGVVANPTRVAEDPGKAHERRTL